MSCRGLARYERRNYFCILILPIFDIFSNSQCYLDVYSTVIFHNCILVFYALNLLTLLSNNTNKNKNEIIILVYIRLCFICTLFNLD